MQVMRGKYIEINKPQPVEEFILDLLDDLDIIDSYYFYSQDIPTAFRVHFAPASTLINGPGSRAQPIEVEVEIVDDGQA